MTIQETQTNKMTRITFQFMPEGGMDTSDISIREESRLIKSINKTDGFTKVNLTEYGQIEIGELGNIRYSEHLEDISNSGYEDIFNRSIKYITSILRNSKISYTVCLVLSGNEISNTYLQEYDDIAEFGHKEFDIMEPEYTEIGNSRIKITLSANKGVVKV